MKLRTSTHARKQNVSQTNLSKGGVALITVDDLRAAIAECQGERNPNANTCMKLAAYYTILREIEPENKSPYSYDSAPVLPPVKSVGYVSGSDFGGAVKGKDEAAVWALIDELITTLEAIQPRLYAGFMRRLNDL